MGYELQAGSRFRSAVSDTEVVAVKAPDGEVDLRCGGHPMVPVGDQPPSRPAVAPGFEGETQVGKRYTDESGELELLCTKAGGGVLSVGDTVLELKDAKPLPSSD